MAIIIKWLGLQLFAGEGGGAGDGGAAPGGDGAGAAANTVVNAAPVDEESRLRALGVPEHVLAKRAKRAGRSAPAPVAQQAPAKEDAAPKQQVAAAEANAPTEPDANNPQPNRMSWDEIMADPEYNKQMQSTIQARLKTAKAAEDNLSKLAPAIELLSKKYGLDASNLDADALTKAITNDDAYYEEKAMQMGISVDAAKLIAQNEQERARLDAEREKTVRQQKIDAHMQNLMQQGEAMKQTFPTFDLMTELRNPRFAAMVGPDSMLSVEDAYYAVHRKEIQAAAMQVTAQRTAQQMANSIRSGQARPTENGTQAQAPSNTTFNYAAATKEQRDALKARIREAAAHGKKLYPGQF